MNRRNTDSDSNSSSNKKKNKKKRNIRLRAAVTVYTAALLAYAVWALLEAFVIPHGIVSLDSIANQTQSEETQRSGSGDEAGSRTDSGINSDTDNSESGSDTDSSDDADSQDSDSSSGSENAVITDTSYRDDNISITISTTRLLDTNIYVADVILSDASCLKTALAGNAFGRNLTETTSSMAQQHNAIFAVNGDYYGFRTSGYVMRDGYLYRSTRADDSSQEDLVFYPDGSMEIIREADVTAQDLEEKGATDIFSFGPGLVQDGEVTVTEGEEVDRAQVTNPRCAIGMLSPLHYVFVVSDGRTTESTGLSLLELAQVMQDLGCTTAYNLDGGGSATMWFNGTVINKPTTFGDTIEERAVSDIIYIGY